jgi:anti-sigma B factor antagonist
MKYASEVVDGVRVIRVEGHWTGGHDDDALRDAFKGWVREGERLFVMDLGRVDLLNSVGLGALVAYYSTLARETGHIKLAGMSDRHRRAAYVARILDLFDDHPHVDEALAAYRKDGLI